MSDDKTATKAPFLGNGDRVFVYGGGGHGRVAADTARRSGLRFEGFIDDDPARGISREAFLAKARYERFAVALGIGDNKARQAIAALLKQNGAEITKLIDPSAIVSPSARIGAGAVVFANAVINDRAVVEEGAIVNSGAIVEHDCVVGAYAHIASNAALSGGSQVGAAALVGAGASLIPNAIVGEGAIVGAGAVVLDEIAPFATAIGVPARPLLKKPF
ncbi:MAG: NeuD/PglB/VioB family sugar acetyltransferase [Helicobacteraceae bacterium]|nr:NeuD/PglB/VioB family sugar acetyltransferase [Helicobacteraceae bacterium]